MEHPCDDTSHPLVSDGVAEPVRIARDKNEKDPNPTPLPASPPKHPSSDDTIDIQRIERNIAAKLDALASVLEAQNRLLRSLVEEKGNPTSSMPNAPAVDQRPTSRLQNMSKASASGEEDMEIERRRTTGAQQKNGTRRSQLEQMSLAQRKREFAMRTAPVLGSGDKSGKIASQAPRESRHSKTRLAVAAARREMERGLAQRSRDEQLERQRANSVGAWIMFGLVVLLGGIALVLGVMAYLESEKARALAKDSTVRTESTQELLHTAQPLEL